MISSSPARPPPSSPINEFPPALAPSSSQINEIAPQELENLKQAQALYEKKYEERVRATISSFTDTMSASLLYYNISKVLDMWNELNGDKVILTPIFDKWRPREKNLELICASYDEARANPIIKSTCDTTKDLVKLVEGVDNADRKINLYKKAYAD